MPCRFCAFSRVDRLSAEIDINVYIAVNDERGGTVSEAMSATLQTWHQVPILATAPTKTDHEPPKRARVDSSPEQRTLRYARFSLEQTASIFTVRPTGTVVPTPLWVAPYAGQLLTWTHSRDNLLERIHHHPNVQLAPCDGRGRLLADPVPVTGRVLLPEELPTVEVAMRAKYGWRFRGARWSAALARALLLRPGHPVGIELTLR